MLIRKAVHQDIPDVMKMDNRIYNYNRTKEFYIWQFFENINPVEVVVAEDEGRVVGTFGIQTRKLSKKNICCGQISWINIEEQYRGTGLFAELSKNMISKTQELDALFVFSNIGATKACQKNLGIDFIGKIDRLVIADNKDVMTESSFICEEIDKNTALESYSQPFEGARFDHNSAFRTWRFSNSPLYRYHKVSIDSGEYAIIKLFQDYSSDRRWGDIVDFECDLNDTERLDRLFRISVGILFKENVYGVTTWANPFSQLCNVLKKIGFEQSGHKSFFGLNVLNSSMDFLYDFKLWHIVQSDTTNY